jgi:hypothetical protein
MLRFNPMRSAATAIVAAGTFLSLTACDSASAPKTGTLSVALTDAPFPYDQVSRADVWVVRIDAKRADASDADVAENVSDDESANTDPSRDWVTVAEPNASIDLLELQHGNVTNLGQVTLPTGRYKGFRLILDTQKSSVTLADGTVLTGASTPGIAWPSAGRTGVKIVLTKPIEVVEGGSLMVVDFDLGNSFVLRGNTIQENGLLFKPVIRATATEGTGSISGTVKSGGTTPAAVTGASVQVLQPGTLIGDTDPTKVVATTTTDATGAYKAAFLLPGSYALRVYPPTGSSLSPALVASVAVTSGQDTGGTDVTLP